jgi:HAD superfamily hydrolase (TIGR01509 family)
MADAAVLFDIDGTLLDSTYLHAFAWRRAFVECGTDIPTAWIHRRIGMGGDQLLRELVGDDSSDLAEAAHQAHHRHFDRLKTEIRPFSKSRELLAAVAARGPKVVLATSADKAELPALLGALGEPDDVDVVTSAEDVEEAKPAPDVFAVAMRRAGVRPERAIAVGDTVWDVLAAGRAGVGCIGVLTGGISRAELEEAGALAVYRDVGELLDGLDDSPLRVLWT